MYTSKEFCDDFNWLQNFLLTQVTCHLRHHSVQGQLHWLPLFVANSAAPNVLTHGFVLMLEIVWDKVPHVGLLGQHGTNAISDIVQMSPKKVRPIYSCSKDVCSLAFSSVTSCSLFMTTFEAGWPP